MFLYPAPFIREEQGSPMQETVCSVGYQPDIIWHGHTDIVNVGCFSHAFEPDMAPEPPKVACPFVLVVQEVSMLYHWIWLEAVLARLLSKFSGYHMQERC